MRPSSYIGLLIVAFLATGVAVWALTQEDGSESTPPAASAPTDGGSPTAAGPEPPAEGPLGKANDSGGPGASAQDRREREVQRAVRRYVAAVDARDGALLCGLVAGIADLDLPMRRSSCADSVSESIGYRDPRGYPVFESVVVTGAPQVEAGERQARATVTVVTEFADRDEPSVEDDVVYLVRRGGGWTVAKPSSTLYRAVGIPDVPPDVLEPPK